MGDIENKPSLVKIEGGLRIVHQGVFQLARGLIITAAKNPQGKGPDGRPAYITTDPGLVPMEWEHPDAKGPASRATIHTICCILSDSCLLHFPRAASLGTI